VPLDPVVPAVAPPLLPPAPLDPVVPAAAPPLLPLVPEDPPPSLLHPNAPASAQKKKISVFIRLPLVWSR
jgi:hypothetical protein